LLNKDAFMAMIEVLAPHALYHTNLNTVMRYTEPFFDDLAERVERVQ